MDEAEPDGLADISFAAYRQAKRLSIYPLDHLNNEIRRRADAIGAFSNEDAI